MKKLIYIFIAFLFLCGCFSSHDPVDPVLILVHDTVWYHDTINNVDTFYIRDTIINYIPYGHSGGQAE